MCANNRLSFIFPAMFVTTLLIFLFMGMAYGEEQLATDQSSDQQIVAWLRDLKPLPKIHYSWPLPLAMFENKKKNLLYQYARLTHAISLRAESVSQQQIEAAARICYSLNEQTAGIPCSIALNHSPWHRKFGKGLPPTDFEETHKAEIDYFSNRLEYVKKILAATNRRLKSNVKISAILLDSERFHVIKKGRKKLNTTVSIRNGLVFDIKKWNESITQKHTLIYQEAKRIYPMVRIEQYDRGGWMLAASKSGWMQSEWYTLDEPGDTFALSLYRINEIGNTREAFTRTVNSAKEHGINEVTPWVALASGFRRQVNNFRTWSDWDYDLIYSWQIGSELNVRWYGDRPDRFAPWHKAKVIVFFPSPFSTKYPAWAKHFVAYVRGANKVRILPE